MVASADNPVFERGRLGPIELRNRIVKSATNEGLSRQGLVTDELIAWHREFTRGGVGMTTLAYCAVSSEGRTFRDQIWLREEAFDGLRRFAEAVHADGARAAIQLGHAGWFSTPHATRATPIGPSATFSPHAQSKARAMDESDFERVTAEFAAAARLAIGAGFDALEVHTGHGYLLSQFLCPWNNRRRDRWGGSLENRARFPRQVLRVVRDAAGPNAAVYAKLNMEDGFSGGLQAHDAIEVARWIEADGSVDALQLTGGHTTRTPFFTLRGDVPAADLIANQRHWLARLGMRVMAPLLLKSFPFEEAYFLPRALEFRAALRLPLMLIGGLTRLDTMERARSLGFDFVAIGRGLIRDPDLVLRMQSGELTASRCVPCNRCIVEMERGGTRCVYRDAPSPPPAASRAL
jgi:2,4-dienoyl-CoA reductase-like NADH-dependent reductase (Old Yellow Enzyme family)